MEKHESWYSVIRCYIDELDEQHKLPVMKYYLIGSLVWSHVFNGDSLHQQLKEKDKELAKKYKKIKDIKVSSPYRVKDKDNESYIAKITDLVTFYHKLTKENLIDNIDKEIDDISAINDYYHTWLLQAVAQMEYVTHATHIAKMTHSSSNGSSVLDSIQDTKQGYLTTSSLDNLVYDGAYPDALFSKLAKFLLLSFDNRILGDLLKEGDVTPLSDFVGNDETILSFLKSLFTSQLNPIHKADALAKQVYFPINHNQTESNYHLLVILNSSSLTQDIYDNYFAKDVRKHREGIAKLKEAEKYSEEELEYVPNSIPLATVMSQPQNVSVKSGSRGGNIRLFSGASPHWENQLKPPIFHQSFFYDNKLNNLANNNILGLQKLLIDFEKAEISFKEPKRLKGITNWVEAIADNVIDYSQLLKQLPSGWSNDDRCRLSISHQIFLDFDRQDDIFLQQKIDTDWQKELTSNFVAWLNSRLKGKQNQFIASDEHSRVWRDVFRHTLREHIEMLTLDFSEQTSDDVGEML